MSRHACADTPTNLTISECSHPKSVILRSEVSKPSPSAPVESIIMNTITSNFRKLVRFMSGASGSPPSSSSLSSSSSISSSPQPPSTPSRSVTDSPASVVDQLSGTCCASPCCHTPEIVEFPLRPSQTPTSPRMITFNEEFIELTPTRPRARPIELPNFPVSSTEIFLRTFRTWPFTAQKNPLELATAGFFYTGNYCFPPSSSVRPTF
jgi:hypothetical protein